MVTPTFSNHPNVDTSIYDKYIENLPKMKGKVVGNMLDAYNYYSPGAASDWYFFKKGIFSFLVELGLSDDGGASDNFYTSRDIQQKIINLQLEEIQYFIYTHSPKLTIKIHKKSTSAQLKIEIQNDSLAHLDGKFTLRLSKITGTMKESQSKEKGADFFQRRALSMEKTQKSSLNNYRGVKWDIPLNIRRINRMGSYTFKAKVPEGFIRVQEWSELKQLKFELIGASSSEVYHTGIVRVIVDGDLNPYGFNHFWNWKIVFLSLLLCSAYFLLKRKGIIGKRN